MRRNPAAGAGALGADALGRQIAHDRLNDRARVRLGHPTGLFRLARHRTSTRFADELGALVRALRLRRRRRSGLDRRQIDAAAAGARAFFALPEAVKRRYSSPAAPASAATRRSASRPPRAPRHADLKEFWHVGRSGNVWPAAEVAGFPAGRRRPLRAFDGARARAAARRSPATSACRATFRGAVARRRSRSCACCTIRRPPADGPAIRAGAHEDINAITLLLGAEEAGLELLDRDGRWLPVNPPPGALVVNIGDMLQRLTNHRLPSTTHRVVNPPPERRGVARYSMPFFLHFAPDYLIRTLPGCVGRSRPTATRSRSPRAPIWRSGWRRSAGVSAHPLPR